MKKIILVLAMCALLGGVAHASIYDEALKWVTDNWGQVSAVYNFDKKEMNVLTGVTLVKDVYVKGLDISVNTDFRDALIGCVDYTFKRGATLSPFIQAGVGMNRIEKLQNSQFGEALFVCGGGVKW